jgi:hypothetical protein
MTIGQIFQLRLDFWGDQYEDAPKDVVRRQKSIQLLKGAYNKQQKQFFFQIDSSNGSSLSVCEASYLVALGRHGNMQANQVTKTWQSIKNSIINETIDEDKTDVNNKSERTLQDYKKRHAAGYINFVINLFKNEDPEKKLQASQSFCETSPLEGMEKIIVLPYDDMPQFHNEYVVHCFSRNVPPNYIAGLSTFRSAFKDQKDLRFLGSKGSFNTCEICNNLNNLLKNTSKKFTKDQLRIVQEFKRLHLTQQSVERKFLDVRKNNCLQLDQHHEQI